MLCKEWTTRVRERCHCPWQAWNEMVFKVLSSPNHSIIPQFSPLSEPGPSCALCYSYGWSCSCTGRASAKWALVPPGTEGSSPDTNWPSWFFFNQEVKENVEGLPVCQEENSWRLTINWHLAEEERTSLGGWLGLWVNPI